MRRALCLVLLLAAATALADVPAGNALFDAGEYRQAAGEYRETFEASGSVYALVKLAKALTFLAGTEKGEAAEATYDEAARYAREAVAAQPGNAEAHMELARALGRLAQFRGVLQSLGLAGEVKSHLEKALEIDPEHDGALHALALWNLEVPWIAGGRSGQVRPLFERAVAIAPSSIIHRVDFGDALLRLGDPGAARVQLEKALSLNARTAADRDDQERARRLLDENFP